MDITHGLLFAWHLTPLVGSDWGKPFEVYPLTSPRISTISSPDLLRPPTMSRSGLPIVEMPSDMMGYSSRVCLRAHRPNTCTQVLSECMHNICIIKLVHILKEKQSSFEICVAKKNTHHEVNPGVCLQLSFGYLQHCDPLDFDFDLIIFKRVILDLSFFGRVDLDLKIWPNLNLALNLAGFACLWQ